MTAIIRTVTGDIPADACGVTYCHEHLVLDSPLIELRFPDIHLNDDERAIREVAACAEVGVHTMVDAMPCSAGRSGTRLAAISEQTGVRIIAATGLHHDRYYGPEHWTNGSSVQELAELFIQDVVRGIDQFDYTGPVVARTGHRAGIIKVATSGPQLNERDKRILRAVSIAHERTRAPILTHCEGGEGGPEQVAFLADHGVDPTRVILSHIDKNATAERIKDLVASGAYLEFDQSLRQGDRVDAPSLGLLKEAVELGASERIVLGTDGARRSLWTAWAGGPGLAWLYARYRELLVDSGIPQVVVDGFFVANPASALSFDPVME